MISTICRSRNNPRRTFAASVLAAHQGKNRTENALEYPATLLLDHLDFPSNYKDFAQLDDYSPWKDPLPPEFINHRHHVGLHHRLILRISWRTEKAYIPMSFIVDTGGCSGFELSEKAIWTLAHYGRMQKARNKQRMQVSVYFGNSDRDIETCRRFEAAVNPARANVAPANLIGLGVLSMFGLVVHENYLGFKLGSNISWI
jgi:hypothetical protein